MSVIRIRFNRVVLKMFATTIFLIFVTAVPIGWFSITEQQKLIHSYMNKTNEAFANFIASHVVSTLSKTRLAIKMNSIAPAYLTMKGKKIEPVLNNFVERNPFYLGAGVYNARKELVAQTHGFQEVVDLEFLFSRTLLHQFGMSLFDKVHHSDEEHRNQKPQPPEMRILIRDENSTIKGVLVVQLDMVDFQKNLNNLKIFLEYINEYSEIYILDDHQKIISKTGTSVYTEGSYLPSSFFAKSGAFVKDIQDILGSDETPPWQVVFVPRGQSSVNITKFKTTFFYFVVFCLFIGGLLGLVVARQITKPLGKLVYSTEKIAQGNLDVQVGVEAGDEIGDLANKFDVMRRNLRDYQNHLKKKITELETLYQVGTIVSSELEYSLLLRTILDTVIDVMSAEKGSIMVYDEHTNLLKIAMAKGLQKDVMRKTVLASGESIAGHVFQTQQPMIVLDTLKDEGFVKLKRKNITPGTMLSVPLISKDQSLGVMNISKSMPYSFNDYDLELFQAIANICATAMDNARLYKLAITDEMTGLYVRRFFYQNVNHLIEKPGETFALIMLDIDHFKSFNDRFGHQIGDDILIEVAKIIAHSVRDADIPCRLGGEEFAVICPGQTTKEAEILSNRLRKVIEERAFKVGENSTFQITVSVGISHFPTHATNMEDLYETADKALYFSKQNGRNKVTVFDDVTTNPLMDSVPDETDDPSNEAPTTAEAPEQGETDNEGEGQA